MYRPIPKAAYVYADDPMITDAHTRHLLNSHILNLNIRLNKVASHSAYSWLGFWMLRVSQRDRQSLVGRFTHTLSLSTHRREKNYPRKCCGVKISQNKWFLIYFDTNFKPQQISNSNFFLFFCEYCQRCRNCPSALCECKMLPLCTLKALFWVLEYSTQQVLNYIWVF